MHELNGRNWIVVREMSSMQRKEDLRFHVFCILMGKMEQNLFYIQKKLMDEMKIEAYTE